MNPSELPLRDIHLPPVPSWWPPAPGWWILLGAVLALVLLAWLVRQLRRQPTSVARAAHLQLADIERAYRENGDGLALARELSELLRRVTISLHPRRDSAGLTGSAWLHYLDTLADTTLAAGIGRALIEAPYRREIDVDGDALLAACRNWLARAARQRRST